MKFAYITDSGTGIGQEAMRQEGIISFPLQISVSDQSYQDIEEMDTQKCLEYLRQEKVLHTSLPSLWWIEEAFEQCKQDGVDALIAVPICPGLSGTTDALKTAAAQIGLPIYCVDTYVTAVVQDYLIHRIRRGIENGESEEQLRQTVQTIVDSTNTLLAPKDMQHFKRGGRLTPLAATMAGLLKITPILEINKKTNGKIDVHSKVRTYKKALETLLEIMKQDPIDESYLITVAHVGDAETAEHLADMIRAQYPQVSIQVIELCNTVSVHAGLGCMAIQYFKQI